MIDTFRETFREEALEILAELENSLLQLDEQPEDAEVIDRVFRALHTIKGAGAMAGFDDVADFTHDIESVYDLVRSEQIPATSDLISLTLAARDQIKTMVISSFGGKAADPVETQRIMEAFRALLPKVAAPIQDKAGLPPSAGAKGPEVTYRIRFRPSLELFHRGINPLGLLKELDRRGHCRIVAQTDVIPPLEKLDPELCYTYWDVILTTKEDIEDIRDVFIFVESESELTIDVIDDGGLLDQDGDYKRLGEILVERGDLPAEDLQRILDEKERLGDILMERKLVDGFKIESALIEQEEIKGLRLGRQNLESVASVRVRSEKLDSLVNLIGELVTVQARLTQTAAGSRNAELEAIAEEVERLTWDLRDQVLNIRMLPIGSTFSKFKRLVRDLSSELGKNVSLVTEGAETELDKTVIERLHDPLVHLIRNCVDHGIEKPQERAAKGKASQGKVYLSAAHSGATVILEVRDNGAGLNRGAIRARAVKRGLLPPEGDISDRELFKLIFLPGFSTAEKVSTVSGRGVGLDVVRRVIEEMRGTVEVSSPDGEGTVFTIKLPLTLAIIDGLLVKIGTESYVFPLSAVEECIELKGDDAARSHGRNLVNLRGEIIPYIRLREQFSVHGVPPEIEQIVVVQLASQRVGFVVDQVVGEHQTVIKSLGRMYQGVAGLSGATILGNGSVALILDLRQLLQMQEEAEEAFSEGLQQGLRQITRN
jgi:two-component system chemotaxis sensor kinase CheA